MTESNESEHATADETDLADQAAETPLPDLGDTTSDDIDLDGIERDLDDVQAALDRLNDGTYWTDEITGEAIPDDVLAERPTTRSATDR